MEINCGWRGNALVRSYFLLFRCTIRHLISRKEHSSQRIAKEGALRCFLPSRGREDWGNLSTITAFKPSAEIAVAGQNSGIYEITTHTGARETSLSPVARLDSEITGGFLRVEARSILAGIAPRLNSRATLPTTPPGPPLRFSLTFYFESTKSRFFG